MSEEILTGQPPLKDKSTCVHEIFEHSVQVNRLTKSDTDVSIVGFSADIVIRCAQCGQDFYFVGVPMGVSTEQPCASTDGKELRVPITPIKGITKFIQRQVVSDEVTFQIERAPRPS